ncbi:lectin-like [Polyodon spathula]|uniref:lectin-like n=1 Tax=Polyodon spathula TaxID=7913 RepID=UPI001B7E342B|nr:lectin-like [Polyodon spathula]
MSLPPSHSQPLCFSPQFSCRKEAVGKGAHLVSVHSEEANKNIICITMKYNHTSPRVWLGGFELFRSEKFVWIDGSEWNYNPWVPGQPDNTANTEDCVEINWKNTGMWNDDKCSGGKSYICGFKD